MSTPLPPELRELEARLEADKNFLPYSLREQVLGAALTAAAKRDRTPRLQPGRWLPFAVAAVALLIALNAACSSQHSRAGAATLELRARAIRLEPTRDFLQEP